MSDVRDTCEHCGKPIATEEDGEMHYLDPRAETFCWSNDRSGRLCDRDPQNPEAPLSTHPRNCRCDEHLAAHGDYLNDLAKDDI